jgi:hypothetical protein
MRKDVLDADAVTGLAGARSHLDAQDRIATELEEVVMHPDGLRFEHCLPDLHQSALRFGGGCDISSVPIRMLDERSVRQRVAIELSIQGDWKTLERHEESRHHVARKMCEQIRAQIVSFG